MIPYQSNQTQEISQRERYLIDSLKGVWEQFEELSHEKLGRILEMTVHFSEPYRFAAINTIAEKLVSSIGVHYLDILASFRERAEQEGFDAKERDATLNDSLTELFPLILGLGRKVAVRSLNDLAMLSTITIGLYGLSQVESAEQAQDWIYSLPKVYIEQLDREHLLAAAPVQFTVTVHVTTVPSTARQLAIAASFVPPVSQYTKEQSQITGTIHSEVVRIVDSGASDVPATLAA